MPARLKEENYPKIGEIFGNLKIISNIPILGKQGQKSFRCECKCGVILLKRLHDLKAGRNKGCRKCTYNLPKVPRKSTMFGKYLSKSVYNRLKIESIRRNIDFNLSVTYLENLLEKQNFKCALSGLDLIVLKELGTKESRQLHNISLDRIDSKQGYIEGNVQYVHKHINYMKWKLEQNYFIDLCKKITNHVNIEPSLTSTCKEGAETTGADTNLSDNTSTSVQQPYDIKFKTEIIGITPIIGTLDITGLKI
jgi:hypothetical protein